MRAPPWQHTHDTVVITEEAHYYYGMEAELIGIDEDDGILKLTDGDIKIVKMAALAKKAGQQQQQQQQQQQERADSSGCASASASSEEEQEDQQRTPDDWYPQFLQKVARDQFEHGPH